MNNLLKSKTRLAFIQIIFQYLSNKNDVFEIFSSFELNYKSTYIENFHNKKKIKFEYNSNFLKKLITYFADYKNSNNYSLLINKFIDFDRKFEKWDKINQSILLAALTELVNTDENKFRIIFNDYLNVGKSFINESELGVINAIIDKIINEKK